MTTYFLSLFSLISLLSISLETLATPSTDSERSQILQFVQTENTDGLRRLIESGVDLNIVDDSGRDLFFHSLHEKKFKTLKFLLSRPEVLANRSLGNFRFFRDAIQTGNLDLVRILLADSRVEVNKTGSSFSDPAESAAARMGDIEILKILLEDPRFDINQRDELRSSGILEAAGAGDQVEMIEFILSHPKFILPTQQDQKPTLLHDAARAGATQVFKKYLGDSRFNHGTKNHDLLNFVEFIALRGHRDILKLIVREDLFDLIEIGENQQSIFDAAISVSQVSLFHIFLQSDFEHHSKTQLVEEQSEALQAKIQETRRDFHSETRAISKKILAKTLVDLEALQAEFMRFQTDSDDEHLAPPGQGRRSSSAAPLRWD